MLPILVERYPPFSYDFLLKLSLVKDSKYHYLLEDNYRNSLQHIKNQFLYNTNEAYYILKQWMLKHDHFPPLELIYWFHKENILLATTYFYTHNEYCDYFYEVFEDYCTNIYADSDKQISIIINTIISTFINTINHSNDELQIFAEEFVDNIIFKIINLIEDNTLKRSPLADLKNISTIYEECMKQFGIIHLKHLLTFDSDYSVPNVVEIHTKQWTTNNLSTAVKEHIKVILQVTSVQNIIEEIKEKLSESDFCWKYLFIIIGILVKENEENALIVKGLVDNLLKEALEEDDNIEKLYEPVLIARHCCYEKARYFQSYANWFSSLNFKNIKPFKLFLKFLTEILPYEPPLYLKIHLNKVPSAPHGCQNLLVDYIVLARTRLADLNESSEYIGLFSDYHETDEGQESDVARVISYYKENKVIAKPLLEAYIFRRQYYEKVFLKQLLKVPERDDPVRAEIINKLHSMGKLPNAMYNVWSKM